MALPVSTVAWVAYEVRATRRGAGTGARRLAVAAAAPVLAIGAVTGALALSYPNGDLRSLQGPRGTQRLPGVRGRLPARTRRLPGHLFSGCDPDGEGFRQPDALDDRRDRSQSGAIGAHYLSNAELLPNGLQLMLFDRISAGGQNRDTDYPPVKAGSTTAAIGSCRRPASSSADCCSLGTASVGGGRGSLNAPGAGLALRALAATATRAALWQRPRPEYLYALSVAILALIGRGHGLCGSMAREQADSSRDSDRGASCSLFSFRPTSRRATSHHRSIDLDGHRRSWSIASTRSGPSCAGTTSSCWRRRGRGVRLPRRGRPVQSGLLEADPRRRAEWRGRGSPGGAPGRLHLSRRGGTPASLLPGGGPGG